MPSRGTGSDRPYELSIDGGFSPVFFPFEVAPSVSRSVWSFSVSKPAAGSMRIAKGFSVLIINFEGSVVGRHRASGRMGLFPPQSVLIARENSEGPVLFARGEHRAEVIAWPHGAAPILERQVEQSVDPNRFFASMPIAPHFTHAIERYRAAISPGCSFSLPAVMSVVYEVASTLFTSGDTLQLAALPTDLPDTVRDLTERVRSKPNGNWALKEAADMAGYSPFHFSRVFKSIAGYGFHEYVDRCRTEVAAERLCTTDIAVDVIASQCGFGTTQGLRESLKEYLGLVPSELRSIPI